MDGEAGNVEFGEKPENISNELKQWVDYAKAHKDVWVKCTDRGDITPTIIVERDGEVQAIISATQVDKHQGLNIAALSQIGFDPDHMTILLDAHIGRGTAKEGQTAEEAHEEFKKKYPKGMQAACDEEGACDLGDIADCLICHRIDRAGNIEMVTLPYAYHGKDGPPFRWLNENDFKEGIFKASKDGDGGKVLTGLIPDALREIMSKKSVLEDIPMLKELTKNMDFTPERARFHTARAIMYILAGQGCLIKDYITPLHMEWIDYKPKAVSFIEKAISKGMFPREARQPMLDVVEAHLGKKTFQDAFGELLKDHAYWLPVEMRGEEDRFAFMFESMVMSPHLPGQEPDFFSEKKSSGVPKRVRVWNGDQTEYLGEGNYVGEATVYFIRMPDGSIQSNHEAEIEPDPANVPDGCSVVSSEGNPKFILDSGDTVYGCQVWWEPVEETPKQTKHKEFGGWNKPKPK